MNYVHITIFIPLILPIDKSRNINHYTDAAVKVHKDIRSHIGGIVTMVIVGSYIKSSKQKLSTKSSPGANLVRFYYVLTQLIWIRYLLKEHKYNIHDNVIYQDNQSAIKFENNGR